MRIPVITKLFERRARFKLRVLSRGYKKLLDDKNVGFPIQLMNALSNTKLTESDLPSHFLFQDDFNVELSVRQYLIDRFGVMALSEAIFYSIGSNTSLVLPLPKKWRDLLNEQGVDVNHFKSDLLWRYQGFRSWVKSVLYLAKSFNFLIQNNSNLKNYVYFNNLIINCFSEDVNKRNIINWYLQYQDRARGIDSIGHNVKNQPDLNLNNIKIAYDDGLPNIKGVKLIEYSIFAIFASIFSLLCTIFKPTYGLFLEESLKLKRVNLANDDDLAREYLFNSMGGLYRPLWTYIAEKKGSRLLFYFYSTNNEFCKKENGYQMQHPWHLINWPYYLVYDNYQADFIRRHNKHNPKIKEVGQIWFTTNEECPSIPENSVAVFDCTVFRPVHYGYNWSWMEYRTYEMANQFFTDIQSVLNGMNINMIHKQKRKSPFIHKKYLSRINILNQNVKYFEMNPDIDALSIIKKTKASISVPFTTTAVIANQEGKPSVYYDPTNIIQKDDRAAHGIEILNGVDELRAWMESVIN